MEHIMKDGLIVSCNTCKYFNLESNGCVNVDGCVDHSMWKCKHNSTGNEMTDDEILDWLHEQDYDFVVDYVSGGRCINEKSILQLLKNYAKWVNSNS